MAQRVKNLPANAEDVGDSGSIPGWGRPLSPQPPTEEGMASHSSILAWRIPWTEEPGRATGPRRVAVQRAEGIVFCWWPCAAGREECVFVFNIYLTASDLNCGTPDVSLLHTDSSCGGLAQWVCSAGLVGLWHVGS